MIFFKKKPQKRHRIKPVKFVAVWELLVPTCRAYGVEPAIRSMDVEPTQLHDANVIIIDTVVLQQGDCLPMAKSSSIIATNVRDAVSASPQLWK